MFECEIIKFTHSNLRKLHYIASSIHLGQQAVFFQTGMFV